MVLLFFRSGRLATLLTRQSRWGYQFSHQWPDHTAGITGLHGTSSIRPDNKKMIDLLEQDIQSAWESEVLQDWRDAILVSLYKKGSKSDCSNFRGKSLLSIVGKLFSRIILNRLVRTIVNGILLESKCGFHASCGTVDTIFSSRNCRSAKNRIFHCTNVSLTYQKFSIP